MVVASIAAMAAKTVVIAFIAISSLRPLDAPQLPFEMRESYFALPAIASSIRANG
jgi:hypothetical protein